WAGLALRRAGREPRCGGRGGAAPRATCFRPRRARAPGPAPGRLLWRVRHTFPGARVLETLLGGGEDFSFQDMEEECPPRLGDCMKPEASPWDQPDDLRFRSHLKGPEELDRPCGASDLTWLWRAGVKRGLKTARPRIFCFLAEGLSDVQGTWNCPLVVPRPSPMGGGPFAPQTVRL
ncbi:unnamed protein product, partial [Gulo gulo]